MIKIFIQDMDHGGSDFEVTAVPRRGETMIIRGKRYIVREVQHTMSHVCTTESIVIKVEYIGTQQ